VKLDKRREDRAVADAPFAARPQDTASPLKLAGLPLSSVLMRAHQAQLSAAAIAAIRGFTTGTMKVAD
jgi:hypothetical protein